ncbi:FecR family protein [Flavivirga eckloniae]|uniref:Anti-sigma factor n=1 Tax=Flavivirga eckloniae TaxID=1803846 RepID=A0A2K9PPY5_9FLAO|nr:FecR family protein [Flavivirga eckloniae]AUP79109.1 anti-sigma factor [Flavivirga eckloniae]
MEFKLIIKKLNKTLTSEEVIVFNKWYDESSLHRDYFNSVKKNFIDGNDIDNIDVEKGWLAIQKNIKTPKTKTNTYWKYTAAAIFIGILASSYFFRDSLFNTTIEETPITINNNIEIGTDKAILTLEDGTVVALEKGQEYISDNLQSNGEKLIYNATTNSKSEIAYNYLTIPRGGQFFIELSDGTQVWLNSESQLKYPVSFIKGEMRQVELVYGEAYFDVSPSTEHDDAKFRVNNQSLEIDVLGTEFNIKAYKDETNIYTTLVEGKVVLHSNTTREHLIPGQQSDFNLNTNAMTLKMVDVYNEISWKEGVFSFERKSLKDIMKVISRWYDFEVIFTNEAIEKKKFFGVLGKDQNIEEILKTIQDFGVIKTYEINNKTIILK